MLSGRTASRIDFDEFWKKLEKKHPSKEMNEESLIEANEYLQRITQSTVLLDSLNLYDGIPTIDFL